MRENKFLTVEEFFAFRVADLVLGGAIFNKVFQPHESHIPYNLQVSNNFQLKPMSLSAVSNTVLFYSSHTRETAD